MAVGLAFVLTVSACGTGDSACAAVPMPAPPAPRPAPPPPPRPVYKAPAPKPAAPKPAAPKAAPKPVRPSPPPIYRPASPRMDRFSPSYDYRSYYNRPQTDLTPLLLVMAMNGAFSPSHPAPSCQPAR